MRCAVVLHYNCSYTYLLGILDSILQIPDEVLVISYLFKWKMVSLFTVCSCELAIGNIQKIPLIKVLSHRKWSPTTTCPVGPSMADLVAIDGPAGPSMAAMDGPLCHKLSSINFATNTDSVYRLIRRLNGCWFL